MQLWLMGTSAQYAKWSGRGPLLYVEIKNTILTIIILMTSASQSPNTAQWHVKKLVY